MLDLLFPARRLRGAHPALYAQLAAFYRQDPAEW
jgi:Mlc titration factor MtfA (ptsG expression regulator)